MADIDALLSWRMQQDGYLMQINQLRDENAKLRELVQYILDECYGDDWFSKKAEELGFKANY